MECLNIDFIGPFPDKGYILVMIDTFSRFVELYATPDATAKSACTALVEHVGRYGSPCILRSDNGPHFASHIIDEFVKIVIVPGPRSRSYRVPTLPDPTGYYYCTLQLGCCIVVAIYSVHVEVN